jgi:hypothetical protein
VTIQDSTFTTVSNHVIFTEDVTTNFILKTYSTLDTIIRIINEIVNPALVVFGCINNMLVLIILSKPSYRNNANCFFLMSLAVFDTLNLVAIGIIFFGDAMHVLVELLGDVFCAMFSYYAYFMVNISNWIIVLITFVRFVAVVFPLRAAVWCTSRAAKCYTLGLAIACATWALPAAIYGRAPTSGTLSAWQCIMDMPGNMVAVYETAQMIVWAVIPLAIIIFFNLSISYTLRKGKSARKVMTSQQMQGKDDIMIMAMVIAVTVVFLALMFPYMLQTIAWRIVLLFGELNEYQKKQRYFCYTVTTVIESTNYAINLFLYCVCCRRFRQDLFTMVIRCR